MTLALPKSGRPRLSSAELDAQLEPFHLDRDSYPVLFVGFRGYYKDSMGAPGVNDRGIYDDAIFMVTQSLFAAYNANCDPTGYRKGKGTGATKGLASLNPGAYIVHKFDLHRGKYLALCQRAGKVTVTRDGDPPYLDTGDFGINIHKGGVNTTSSEGCQTIHPTQWDAFIANAVDQAQRYHGAQWKRKAYPYVLLTEG